MHVKSICRATSSLLANLTYFRVIFYLLTFFSKPNPHISRINDHPVGLY